MLNAILFYRLADHLVCSWSKILLLAFLVCLIPRPAHSQMHTDITVSLQIASSGSLLSACYSVLEAMIGHMTSASTLALDQGQVEQVHAAMVGAFNAVLYFLSQCQGQVDDQDTRLTDTQVGNKCCHCTHSELFLLHMLHLGFSGDHILRKTFQIEVVIS